MDDGPRPASPALSPRATRRRVLGAVVSVLACVFVVVAVARRWDETRHALAGADVGWAALGWLLALAAMAEVALVWRSAQRLVGPALDRFDTVTLYFQGELAKYIPGGAWGSLGRAELARSRGAPAGAAYTGVALSLLGLFVSCALVAAGSLVLGATSRGIGALVWLLAVLPVGVLVLHPRLLGPLLRRVGRLSGGGLLVTPRWREACRLIVEYVPAWFLVVLATASVARAVTADLDLRQLALATTLSWLAGFLVVGAPGGLGVREAVFVSLAAGLGGRAPAVAVLARMAFVTADAAGAGLSLLARRVVPTRREGAREFRERE